MASIVRYPVAGGTKWEVRYRKADGKITRKRGFVTKRSAQAWADEASSALRRGDFTNPALGRVTVGQLGKAWLGTQGHLKASTRYTEASSWRTHVEPRWGTTPVGKVLPADVQSWVADLATRRRHGVVARAYSVLSRILRDAVRDGLVASNACQGVRVPPAVAAPIQPLSPRQVEALAAECSASHRALVYLLAYTGLRWGEAVGLRFSDVNFQQGAIHVARNVVSVGGTFHVGTPKSGKSRLVQPPSFVLASLAELPRTDSGLLFPGPGGGFMTRPPSASGWLRKAAEAAGVPTVTPHGFRHTAASLAIASGASVKEVQSMLGHSSATLTLDRYAHLLPGDMSDLAARMGAARDAGLG